MSRRGIGYIETTFNIPNFSGKIPLYNSSVARGTTTNGKAPNITGGINTVMNRSNPPIVSGCFSRSGVTSYGVGGSGSGSFANLNFKASSSSSVYSDSATSITPAGVYVGGWCIKY